MHISPRVLPVFIILTMCLNEEYARNLNQNSPVFSPVIKLDVEKHSKSEPSYRNPRFNPKIGQFMLVPPNSNSNTKQQTTCKNAFNSTKPICGDARGSNDNTNNDTNSEEAGAAVESDGDLSDNQLRQAVVQEELDEYYLLGHILPRGEEDTSTESEAMTYSSDIDMPVFKTNTKGEVMTEVKTSDMEHTSQPGQWMVFANSSGRHRGNHPRHQPVFRPAHSPFVMTTRSQQSSNLRKQAPTYSRFTSTALPFSLPGQHRRLTKDPIWMNTSLNHRPQANHHFIQSKESGLSGNRFSKNPYDNSMSHMKTFYSNGQDILNNRPTDNVKRIMGEEKFKYNNMIGNQNNSPQNSLFNMHDQYRTYLQAPAQQKIANDNRYHQNVGNSFNHDVKTSQHISRSQQQQIYFPYSRKPFKPSDNPNNLQNEIVFPINEKSNVIVRIPSHLNLPSDMVPNQIECISKANQDYSTGDNGQMQIPTFSNLNNADNRKDLFENLHLYNNYNNEYKKYNNEKAEFNNIGTRDGISTSFKNISPKSYGSRYNLKNSTPSVYKSSQFETSYLNLLPKSKSASASSKRKSTKRYKLTQNDRNLYTGSDNNNFKILGYKSNDENDNIAKYYRDNSIKSTSLFHNNESSDPVVNRGIKSKPRYTTNSADLVINSSKQEYLDDATIQEMIDKLYVDLRVPSQSHVETSTEINKDMLDSLPLKTTEDAIQIENKMFKPVTHIEKLNSLNENGDQKKQDTFQSNQSSDNFKDMANEWQNHGENQIKALIPHSEEQGNQISQHIFNSYNRPIARLESHAKVTSLKNNDKEMLDHEKGDDESPLDSSIELPTADLKHNDEMLNVHNRLASNNELDSLEYYLKNNNVRRFEGINEHKMSKIPNNLVRGDDVDTATVDNVRNEKELVNGLADLVNHNDFVTKSFGNSMEGVEKIAPTIKRLRRRQLDQELGALDDLNAVVDPKAQSGLTAGWTASGGAPRGNPETRLKHQTELRRWLRALTPSPTTSTSTHSVRQTENLFPVNSLWPSTTSSLAARAQPEAEPWLYYEYDDTVADPEYEELPLVQYDYDDESYPLHRKGAFQRSSAVIVDSNQVTQNAKRDANVSTTTSSSSTNAPATAATATNSSSTGNASHQFQLFNSGGIVKENETEETTWKGTTQKTINETAVLLKLLNDLNNLRSREKPIDKSKDGLACSTLEGTWLTDSAGIRISITVADAQLTVDVAARVPQKENTLLSRDWTMTGQQPFKHGGPFVLTAVHSGQRKLARFVGQCRVCHNRDLVTGVWSVVHPANDCRELDLGMTTVSRRDVFRRDRPLSTTTEPPETTEAAANGTTTAAAPAATEAVSHKARRRWFWDFEDD